MCWTRFDKIHSAYLNQTWSPLFLKSCTTFLIWKLAGVRCEILSKCPIHRHSLLCLCTYAHMYIGKLASLQQTAVEGTHQTPRHRCSPGPAPGWVSQSGCCREGRWAGPQWGSWCWRPPQAAQKRATDSYPSWGKPCLKLSSGLVWVYHHAFWILAFSTPELQWCAGHGTAVPLKATSRAIPDF